MLRCRVLSLTQVFHTSTLLTRSYRTMLTAAEREEKAKRKLQRTQKYNDRMKILAEKRNKHKKKAKQAPTPKSEFNLVNKFKKGAATKSENENAKNIKQQTPKFDERASKRIQAMFEGYNQIQIETEAARDLSDEPFKLFTKHQFIKSCSSMESLPNTTIPEVAFIGRSNVGKSSLINALFGTKKMVKVSKTPGRTQLLNYFSVGNIVNIVDMPGYGYAEAPLKIVRKWHSLIESYLFKRSYPELSANDLPHYVKPTPTGPLRMIYWLLDARRAALKQTDIEFLKFLQRRKLNFTVVLTKADKVSNQDKELTIAYIINELLKESSSISFTVLPTSSKDGYGIDEVKYAVLKHTGVITRKGEKLMYKPVVLPKQVEIVEAERKMFQEKLAEKKEEQKRKQQTMKEQKENKEKGIEEPQPTETISEIVDGRMPEDPEKKKAKKKKKTILKIGELSKDNKYIQRTRYLDDTVERTETQYKRYKKVQMFSTKKGRNLTKKKRKN